MPFNYNCKKPKLAIKSITGILAVLELQGVQLFLGDLLLHVKYQFM